MDSLQPQGAPNIPAGHTDTDPPWNPAAVFKFIKADQFFPAYCPTVGNYKQKVCGRGHAKKPAAFTERDRAAIMAGLALLFTDLTKQL